MIETVKRSCSLCEASCGLVMEVENNQIMSVKPDYDDPFSQGYVCPKGMAIAEVHNDPDRLRRPMRRKSDGSFEEIGWDAAFDLIDEKLNAIRSAHGANAIAVYYGNPLGHNYGGITMIDPLVKAIGTKNRTGASSQDTAPRFAASYYLYGNTLVTPTPDLENTDWFLCIGANPVVSQGSAMVAPNVKGRIKAIRERGGKVITVDPRFTETSKIADEHVSIRPGGDAAFLLAMLWVLIDENLIDQQAIDDVANDWDFVAARVNDFSPEKVEAETGIDPQVVRRLTREFAAASRAVVYTRLGVCNNRWGTLGTWATDVVNLAGGRLGKRGGWMFAEPILDAATIVKTSGMSGHGRWHTRVRGLPETQCDMPASMLSEEIETPGEGQIRAMITIAGNPVLSTPNTRRLSDAIGSLEFMVSIDLYVNETTRHADLILPPCWQLAEDHAEALTSSFGLRTRMRWCPPVVEKEAGEKADWEIMLEIAKRMGGGPTGFRLVDRALGLAEMVGWRFDPETSLDLLLRIGPHGNRLLPWAKGVTLAQVKAEPYGIDLGMAPEGVTHRVFHKDKRVHLWSEAIEASLASLAKELGRERAENEVLMIGRRHLRSNNSWMHNVASLVTGKDRCVLFVNPVDAERAGIRDSEPAFLSSRVFSGEVPVRVTSEIMPGVVSLPHGWGHGASAEWQSVAGAHAGVSANDWSDDQDVEDIVGQSILNGITVTLARSKSGQAAA
jgi:anaerobic selenocysteine-containing dehydrogenase